MTANSSNRIITVRPGNQENNLAGNRQTSGSSSQSAYNRLLCYAQQIGPNSEPKDEDSDEGEIIIEDNGVPQKIAKAVSTTKSLEFLTQIELSFES